ncbi:hypothetical protein AVEN_163403-1 [Araneus ventricosus]|uniref:Uncharacterized protein n=1 Tax=Araneus ventricosus TaxID=182803 RepID=A0A4Y2UWL2_ARAVE|nr:hypothetical protein AVEN_163403-1 [Araneus ventricosus]
MQEELLVFWTYRKAWPPISAFCIAHGSLKIPAHPAVTTVGKSKSDPPLRIHSLSDTKKRAVSHLRISKKRFFCGSSKTYSYRIDRNLYDLALVSFHESQNDGVGCRRKHIRFSPVTI